MAKHVYFKSRQRNSGSLTILFLGISFVLIGIMTLSFLVGGAVNRKLQNQQTADSAAIAISAYSSQGFNMIATNNQGIGAGIQINNSILIVTYYSGLLRALSYSLTDAGTDIAKAFLSLVKMLGTEKGSEIAGKVQTSVFDKVMLAGRLFIASSAGLTKFNFILRDHWMSIAPFKALESARLNTPGSLAFSFQNSDSIEIANSFSLMKYEPQKSNGSIVVSSPKSTICAVTSIKPNGNDNERDKIMTYLQGPIQTLIKSPFFQTKTGAINTSASKFLDRFAGLLDKIHSFLPIRLGFMKCGLALKSPLFDLFSNIFDEGIFTKFAQSIATAANWKNIPLLQATHSAAGKFMPGCNNNIFQYCTCPDVKNQIQAAIEKLGSVFSPLKDLKIRLTEEDVNSKNLQSKMFLNVWSGYQSELNKLNKKYPEFARDQEKYEEAIKNSLWRGLAETLRPKYIAEFNKLQELRTIHYSNDTLENCEKEPQSRACKEKFVVDDNSHMCPWRSAIPTNAVSAELEFKTIGVSSVIPDFLKTSLGFCYSSFPNSRSDYAESLKSRLETACTEYDKWAKAAEGPDKGYMIVDWSCQADAYVNNGNHTHKKCKNGLKNARSPKVTTEKESTLGFTFIKNTPTSLQNFRTHSSYRVLVATPEYTPTEARKALSEGGCTNFETYKIDDNTRRKCLLDLSSTYASKYFDKSTNETEQQHNSKLTMLGGITQGGKGESKDIWKRSGYSLGGARSIYLPQPSDPSPAPHMQLFWPAWSISTAKVKLSDFVSSDSLAKGVLKVLDNLNGAM